jgi:hypothetical protein
VGGNPGASDSVAFAGTPLADADSDGLAAILEYAMARSDSVANDGTTPNVIVESLVVGGIAQQFLTITATTPGTADSVALAAEFSPNLTQAWQSAVYVAEIINGNGTVSRKWRSPVPHSGGQQFLRLKATYAP